MKDSVLLPKDVDFTREIEAEEDAGEPGVKRVRRILFSYMNPYPKIKIMTFNKHIKDFTLNVNYADLDYLSVTEVAYQGSHTHNLTSKGLKAHFQLDDSGILTCTDVESVFEKTVSPEEQEKKEKDWKEATESIDWSKLGDNIKSFFGIDEKKDEGSKGGEVKKDEKDDVKKTKDSKDTKKEENKDKKDEKSMELKKHKIEIVEMEIDGTRNDLELLDGESCNSSKARLDDLNQADLDRLAIETALNKLQSFSFDLSDKMEDDEFQSASSVEERESVVTKCGKVSEWLDKEAGMLTPVEEFTTKLKVWTELIFFQKYNFFFLGFERPLSTPHDQSDGA